MSKQYFYSHIVTTEDISLSLGDLDMPSEDRIKLIELAHETLHHEILGSMLDHLSEDDKKEFLLHLSSDDHQKAWIILKNNVQDAEDIIIAISEKVKKQIHTDIKKASK